MIGLLGGTFNPPHNAHLALERAAEEQLDLDELAILVAARPGHKRVELDADTRLRLVRAAFPGHRVELDDHERTVDMLREGRWVDPVFLIGADEFRDFPRWKEPDAVLELSRLGVASRPGYARGQLEQVLSELGRPERVLFFEMEPVAVSSSDIRERVARGEPVDGLVPPAVSLEISRRGLYRG